MLESKRRKPVVPQRLAESEEEIKAGLRDFSARNRILIENHAELIAQYPEQWVALGDNWEFVVADSHKDLLDKLRECGAYPRTQRPDIWKSIRRDGFQRSGDGENHDLRLFRAGWDSLC